MCLEAEQMNQMQNKWNISIEIYGLRKKKINSIILAAPIAHHKPTSISSNGTS